MKHLIIGAGRMGMKHAKMLQSLGDACEMVDLGWDASRYDFRSIDSILVCTPPETHRDYINRLTPIGIPLFIEKPVITHPGAIFGPSVSMVACNWRWCYDIPDIGLVHIWSS